MYCNPPIYVILVVGCLPQLFAAPLIPLARAGGDSVNFDLKIWAKSTGPAVSAVPTNFEKGKTEESMTPTTNADYTAEGTDPDYKTPEGSSEKFFIVGQMHFNEVPGTVPRQVQILEGEKSVTVSAYSYRIALYFRLGY